MTVGGIVDTHAHICDTAFDQDRSDVLSRARIAGVSAVIAVGEDLADAWRNLRLAKSHPMLRPAAGLYPTHLDLETAEEMTAVIRNHRDRLAAIGEVGLDYWAVQNESQREIQRHIFLGFIRLGQELDLPLNVHSRSAGRHAVELLLQNNATKVQLHAFDGRPAAAMPAAEAGFFFSIPPSIVRSQQKQNLVRRLPLSCLLLETDSPVLGPSPDARNEPANAIVSLEAVAAIKNMAVAEVADVIRGNTARLYGPLSADPLERVTG